MVSEGTTSYQGLVAQENAKVHAGHVYSSVTNNYSNQPAEKPNPPLSSSTPIQRTELAPAEDPVHGDLIQAAREGLGTTRLEYLFSRGANVDVEDKIGLTALYYASLRGDNENVRCLVDRGANVNAEHCDLGTPIAVAALRRHPEVVKLLLQHKARVLDRSETSGGLGSALCCACYGGDLEIFETIMLNLPYDDHLAHDQVVRIKAFSILSITDILPDGLGRLLRNKQHGFFLGSAIRCTPILLAAARCHFDILHLSWSRFHYDYPSLNFWNFLEKENEAEPNGLSQSRRNIALHLSMDTRSVNSYASRASTTSAFSLLGFPLPAPEHTRSTLLMWAAATLNLSLIKHLLKAGASSLTQDQKGRNAVHYAAAAFADATFRDVRECVKLLLAADQALLPTLLCIQTGHRPLPPGAPISPLNLVVRENHAALDPRTCYIWGHEIHQTFISSFLDPLPTEELKAKLARVALPDALLHDMCPAASIELLCKHAVGTCRDLDPLLTSRCMNVSLRNALSISAAEHVISILLDHGSDPNAAVPERPLITAMTQKASAVIVTKLLDHGADPYIDSLGDSRMSPHEYARRTNRQDLILLFEQKACRLSPPKLTPTDSAHLTTTESPKIVPRESQSQGMPTATKVLNKVDELDELDELDDLDEDPGHELGFCEFPMRTAQDSGGSGRLWFSGITARFRKNSTPK